MPACLDAALGGDALAVALLWHVHHLLFGLQLAWFEVMNRIYV